MSLRDFNAPSNDDPIALHKEPLGNGGGLESFHTTQPEDIEPNNMPKIVGAVAVALMLGAAGVALYAHSGNQPKPVMAASNLPATPAPQPAPAAAAPGMPSSAPAPSPQAVKAAKAATTDPNSLRAAEVKTPAPGKSASQTRKSMTASKASSTPAGSAAQDRMAADSSQSSAQPQTQQAITAPQPSPSDVATNNTQSGVAVPQGANTASDIPAAPQQPQPANPVQQPAQQAGQQAGAAQAAGQVTQ